eukprot:Sdes_comp19633_c0_seq1m11410
MQTECQYLRHCNEELKTKSETYVCKLPKKHSHPSKSAKKSHRRNENNPKQAAIYNAKMSAVSPLPQEASNQPTPSFSSSSSLRGLRTRGILQSYKEPSLSKKLRQGDPNTFSI